MSSLIARAADHRAISAAVWVAPTIVSSVTSMPANKVERLATLALMTPASNVLDRMVASYGRTFFISLSFSRSLSDVMDQSTYIRDGHYDCESLVLFTKTNTC